MKRFFTIAAMICAVAMTACTDPNENPYDGAPEPVFTLSTTSVEVPQAGGNFEVPFTIENPGEWAQVRATTATKWIKDLAWDAEAKKITFTAAANNSDDPLTGGVITVAYNFKEYNISVTQLGIAYDYRWTVPADPEMGAYAVSYWGPADEDGKVLNGTLQLAALDGEELAGIAELDLFFSASAAANNYCFDIPAGVYEFDAEDTGAAGTIGNEYSYVSTDVENEFEEFALFASGALEVTKDGWVARMFDENGKSYRIECAAVPHVDAPMEDMYNGLNEITGDTDLAFDAQQFYLMVDYWGDYYGEGTHNYSLSFNALDGYTVYTLDLIATEKAETDMLPTGEFTISSDVEAGNAAYNGNIEGGYIVGSFIKVPDFDAGVFRYGFMKSGKIKISTENPEDGIDAIWKVEIEAYDDHHAPGYKISGTYEGWQYGITDNTQSAPAAPTKAAANKQTETLTFKARR